MGRGGGGDESRSKENGGEGDRVELRHGGRGKEYGRRE